MYICAIYSDHVAVKIHTAKMSALPMYSSHVPLRNFPAEELSIVRNRVKAKRPRSHGSQQLLDHITSQEWYPKEPAAKSSLARQVVDNLSEFISAENMVVHSMCMCQHNAEALVYLHGIYWTHIICIYIHMLNTGLIPAITYSS